MQKIRKAFLKPFLKRKPWERNEKNLGKKLKKETKRKVSETGGGIGTAFRRKISEPQSRGRYRKPAVSDTPKEVKNEGVKNKIATKLSKEEKQILFIIALMAVAIALFLLFLFLYRNIGVFVYQGIKFQKISSEGLILYHGKVGMKTAAGTFNYNLYLRNDPKKLADIPVNISLLLRRTGYISFQPAISKCYGSSLVAYEIASLLSALGMQVKGATTSHEVAIDEGIDERDCADAVNKTVIVLQSANQTSIEQDGECYKINIANCKVIEASEAFILAILKNLWNIVAS